MERVTSILFKDEYDFKLTVGGLSLRDMLSDFGFKYEDIYYDGCISDEFISVMNNNTLDKNYRIRLLFLHFQIFDLLICS